MLTCNIGSYYSIIYYIVSDCHNILQHIISVARLKAKQWRNTWQLIKTGPGMPWKRVRRRHLCRGKKTWRLTKFSIGVTKSWILLLTSVFCFRVLFYYILLYKCWSHEMNHPIILSSRDLAKGWERRREDSGKTDQTAWGLQWNKKLVTWNKKTRYMLQPHNLSKDPNIYLF